MSTSLGIVVKQETSYISYLEQHEAHTVLLTAEFLVYLRRIKIDIEISYNAEDKMIPMQHLRLHVADHSSFRGNLLANSCLHFLPHWHRLFII